MTYIYMTCATARRK